MEAHLIEIGSEKAVDHIKQGPKSGWRSLLPLGLVLLAASTRLSWHSALMSVPALFVSDALKTESLSATEDPGYSFPLKGAADGNVWAYYRLPTHIWPEAYRITLATELDQDGGEEISKDDLAKLEDLKDSRNAASRHGDFEFAGSVEMDFSVVNETDFMVLNSAELLLDTAEIAVRGRKSDSAQWTEPKFHAVPRNSTATEEQLFLRFASPSFNPPANTTPAILEPGTVYTLRISFKGKLGESLLGFYRSEYFRHGRTRYLASTQFESTDARRAFPCLDEPLFKAKFSMVSYTRPHLHSLFNMPQISESTVEAPSWWGRPGRWRRAEFGATPLMSSYLVAYVVSDFEHISGIVSIPIYSKKDMSDDVGSVTSDRRPIDHRPVKIAIYFPPGLEHTAHLALKTASIVLPFYSRLYRVPYPLPKLDLIAIPDFASGAMENWGLVTFRSTALLYDTRTSSSRDMQQVVATVAHELAHLWTGDLVTMKWWNDLWLNEGFAQYIENVGAEEYGRTDQVEGGWRMEEQFYADEEDSSLWEDAGTYTHAVVNKNLRTPGEIEEAFDAITYSKGSSLIRMLRAWVNEARKNVTNPPPPSLVPQSSDKSLAKLSSDFGILAHPDVDHPDYFFRRMHSYLSTYSYSTATTAELWAKLDLHHHNHSGHHPPHNHTNDSTPVFGVERTMSTWTEQEGFPVVIMTPLPDGSLKLRQERYLHAHCCSNSTGLPGENSTWWIPFSFQVYTNNTPDGSPYPVGEPRTVLMTEREMTVPNVFHCNDPSSGCQEMRLVKANFRQTAFYRVQYPPGDVRIFADWIEKSFFLPNVGRAGLLSDAISMNLAGRSDDIESTLILFDKMLRPLLAEEDYVVWSVTISALQRAFFHGAFEIHPSYGLVKKWLQLLVKPAIKQIGWDEERKDPHLRRLLRTILLRFAVAVGEHRTTKEAKRLFKAIAGGEIEVARRSESEGAEEGAQRRPAVTPDVLDVIYDSAMLGGNQREHETLQAMFLNATFATEQQRILHAMCMAKPLFLVRRNLLFVTSPAVRLQDTFRALIWITSSSYEANFEVWTFFRENWEDLMTGHKYNLGPIGQRFGEVLKVIASTLGSPVHLSAMKSFFKREFDLCSTPDEQRLTDPDPDCRHTMPRMAGLYVKKGLEIAEMRMAFVEKFGDRVGKWVVDMVGSRIEELRGKGLIDEEDEMELRNM